MEEEIWRSMKISILNPYYLFPILLCVAISVVACAQQYACSVSVNNLYATAGAIGDKITPVPELTSKDVACIQKILLSATLTEAKHRFHVCRSSPSSQMSYAYAEIKFHAPHAQEAIIKAIPNSYAAMQQLYSFSSITALGSHAYEEYYTRLFLLGRTMPQIIPRLFAVAAQYGTDNPNVDENTWFCDELTELYKHNSKEYLHAVKMTKHTFYRRVALDCRSEPDIP